MGDVPNAHAVSISRPTPQETIIALVVILTQIIGSSYIELNPVQAAPESLIAAAESSFSWTPLIAIFLQAYNR